MPHYFGPTSLFTTLLHAVRETCASFKVPAYLARIRESSLLREEREAERKISVNLPTQIMLLAE